MYQYKNYIDITSYSPRYLIMLKYYATLYVWITVTKTTKILVPMLTTSVENETIKWDGKSSDIWYCRSIYSCGMFINPIISITN